LILIVGSMDTIRAHCSWIAGRSPCKILASLCALPRTWYTQYVGIATLHFLVRRKMLMCLKFSRSFGLFASFRSSTRWKAVESYESSTGWKGNLGTLSSVRLFFCMARESRLLCNILTVILPFHASSLGY
jgi:hypothetical protein